MKRLGLLLVLLSLLVVACGSGAAETTSQTESEGAVAEATASPAADEPAGEPAADQESQNEATAPPADLTGDPMQPREGDWRQGNSTDPAVTIIEYGDFQ